MAGGSKGVRLMWKEMFNDGLSSTGLEVRF